MRECQKKTNIKIIQTFQSKVLRFILNKHCYIKNEDLHRDLGIEYIGKDRQKFAKSHEVRFLPHKNILAIQLLCNSNQRIRPKRTKPHELVYCFVIGKT